MDLPPPRIVQVGLMLFVTMAAIGMAACGATMPGPGPSPAGPTATVTVPVELPITIALAGRFTAPGLTALDEQIARFQVDNPDVRVELVRAPRSTDRWRDWIATRIDEGDTSIDLFLLNATWPAELAAGGGLVPLDDCLSSLGIETDAFLPNTIEANTFGGGLIALPWAADGGLLFYRRDLLEKHGYAPPSTWEELQKVALDVKAREGLPYGFVWQGAAGENLTCSTLEFVWAAGGGVLDKSGNVCFDSQPARAALQQMNDLLASGASPPETGTYDDGEALTAFRDGKALFLRSWLTAWEYLSSQDSPVAGQVWIAPLPTACLGGQSLALSTHSLHPEGALRFMGFLVGYDQQAQMALSANQAPAIRAAYQDADLLAAAPIFRVLFPAFSQARIRPVIPEYAALSAVVSTEVSKMLAGEQGIDPTLIRIQDEIESVLQECRTPSLSGRLCTATAALR